jgi:hypothetical protein
MEPKIINHFWGKVVKTDTCWNWQGYTTKSGYGLLTIRSVSNHPLYAHRIAWELTNGVIAYNLHVLHSCDNPRCCNPGHLFLGTQRDNNMDRDSKKRAARGNKNGAVTHPEKNPFIINRGSGLKGANHPMSKLSDAQIQQIISEYPNFDVKQKLADQFNISLTHLQRIAKKYNLYKDQL